jgi:sodium transport system permease protein
MIQLIRLIAIKELMDHLRDRRSVLGSFILPIVGPLLLVGIFQLVANLQRERPLALPVIGAEAAPRLIAHLRAQGIDILPAPADPEALVRSGQADMVLVIEPTYAARFSAGKSAHLQLIIDASRSEAQRNVRRVERLLLGYSQTLAALRLLARGVAPEVAAPLDLAEIDLATPEKLAAHLLNVVPLILMLAALVGGMNLAIDISAGERERGSLEPLLLNPVSRWSIALGKWSATVAASSVVVLITLLGFMITVRFLPLEALGMKVLLGPYQALIMLAAVLPLALVGSGLQLLIATFARSFKEAQTYLNLLNLLPMAPSMFLMLEPAQTHGWILPIPTMAQVAVIGDVMRGERVPAEHLLLIGASSLAYTAICLTLLVHLLGKERIIFGRS